MMYIINVCQNAPNSIHIACFPMHLCVLTHSFVICYSCSDTYTAYLSRVCKHMCDTWQAEEYESAVSYLRMAVNAAPEEGQFYIYLACALWLHDMGTSK
jgi:hypothetical protein